MALLLVSPGVSHAVAFRWWPWLNVLVASSVMCLVSHCSGFFLQQGSMILFQGPMGSKKEEAEVDSLPKIWAQNSHNALCAIFP